MEFRKVVVGVDGSPASRAALTAALELVPASVPITVVSVEEALPQYVAMRGEVDEAKQAADDYFERIGREATDEAKLRGREIQIEVLRGHAAQKVVEFARKENADLIVIGHSGHSSVWGTFLGTTADKIVRHAACSVLVVRPVEQ
jgi:nucleotide-binding universal stress UspA family protein